MGSQATYQLAAVTTVAGAPQRSSHYAIVLEGRTGCACCCCRDYADARLSFIAPGKPIEAEAKARVLSFSRDLLMLEPLASHFGDTHFFGFDYPREALYISKREMAVVGRLFDSVAEETAHGLDEFTNTLLAEKINLVLTNCRRFYQRQLILREDYCQMHVAKAQKIIDRYYSSARGCSLPTAARCAQEMGDVSESYLTTVIRFVTGRTFAEFAQQRQLHMAKQLLSQTDRTVADIARTLGFPSEACFREFFRLVAGTTPADYRHTLS